jgi:hypothetical protein
MEEDRAKCSFGEQVELHGQSRLGMTGILRLSLARHVSQLDAAQDHTGSGHRLESEHGSDPPLDDPMILLNSIIQEAVLPDPNRVEPAP